MFRALSLAALTFTVACGPRASIKDKADVMKVLSKTGIGMGFSGSVARDTYNTKLNLDCPRGGSIIADMQSTYSGGTSVVTGTYSYNACSMLGDAVISGNGKIAISTHFTNGASTTSMTYEGALSVEDKAAGTHDDLVFRPLDIDMTATSMNGVVSMDYTLNGTVDANGTTYTFAGEHFSASIETTVTP